MNERRDDLLALVPAYRRGELSPALAHEVALALKDPAFAEEAERETALQDVLTGMSEDLMPRGLLQAAVHRAVGADAPKPWFSVDTILLALGVGIICAAIAQLVASRVDLPAVSELLASLVTMGSFASTGMLIIGGMLWLGMMGLLVIGAILVYRALRS